MRYTMGTLGAAVALAVGCLAGTSGVAQAESGDSGRLYSPSALVLSVGNGEDAATASVQRAVTLRCAPTPGGDHPTAAQACTELRALNGEFTTLTDSDAPGRVCTKIWNPVVVTADGVWEGRRVSWSHTFANPCVMEAAQATQKGVFAF
ncbi:subtilase-type protease inhibitor [Streptomyces sp. NPDC004647]|uniref:subtilase-type protease inhibitor n=1 Tax=Streptomyces sp. NPDC004647 TaxID=3154671 RepID=UPI0033B3F7E3